MGLLVLLLPLISVVVFTLVPRKVQMDWVNIVTASLLLVAGVLLTGRVAASGSVTYPFSGGFFYVDSLSMLVLDTVLVIGLLAGIYSTGYLGVELKHGRIQVKDVRNYYILMYLFIFAMALALTVRNMGIVWIAIEATTLASAFLVGFYNDKKSVEAAWKYVIICSVGIAVALLGIIFLHLSYSNVKGLESIQLEWTGLYSNAKALNTPVLKLAFIFILIGFGTKAGLAPMHTWLPDAHSQAPSPISALLSGVLLNSAVYAIIRTVSIVNRNTGSPAYTGKLLIGFGLLSIATAALFIITQKDYKRLLAYSSIEHIGLITMSIGIFTPASIFAGLLHMLNHSFTKSLLFFSSGNIFLKYETREISRVKGALKALPVSGTAMLIGLFAIAGTPPFSVFASELNILVSAFSNKNYLAGGAVVLLLALVFTGLAIAAFNMFYPGGRGNEVEPGEPSIQGSVVIIVLLVIVTLTGLFIPGELKALITGAQRIVYGG